MLQALSYAKATTSCMQMTSPQQHEVPKRGICSRGKSFSLLIVLIATTLTAQAQNQWVLQRFLQRVGAVNNEFLGYNIYGFQPTTNVPYNVVVSRNTGQRGYPNPGPPVLEFHQVGLLGDSVCRTLPGSEFLAGDLNEDGYTDIVVTVSTSNDYDTVCIYWGTPSWVDTLNPIIIPNEYQFDRLSAKAIGDVNNDGHNDLVLSAHGYSNLGYNRGKVYFFFGPRISSSPDLVLHGDTVAYALGGRCLIADLNNDGLQDFIVGGSVVWPMGNYQYVRFYWGRANTLTFDSKLELRGHPEALDGIAAFDVNGDGVKDLLWTDRTSSNSRMRCVKVHYGGSTLRSTPDLQLKDPQFAEYGNVIANAGDMNGDGYDDILVGSYHSNTSGFVFLYGAGIGIDEYFDAAVGMSTNGYFGWSVAGIGDVNGDGLADIVVGAPYHSFDQKKGYWAVFLGSKNIHNLFIPVESLVEPESPFLFQNFPNPFNPETHIRFFLPQQAYVNLRVLDLLGRHIHVLKNELMNPGQYTIKWNASHIASGAYFYQLHVNSFVQTRTMLLMR